MRLLFTCFLIFAVQQLGIAQPTLNFDPVIINLSSPMQLVHAGDGSKRIFLVGKEGDILVYDRSYAFLDTFLIHTDLVSTGEQGLLSLAFHPSYASNGLFYIYYNNGDGDLEISRYHVSANPNKADLNSRVKVLTIAHPINSNHNGGELHFGNDGYLYLSTGDGGGGGDGPNNAQTTGVLLGKILRLAVTTGLSDPYYTVPASNPFGNEVFCYGLRNPFRWSFDRLNDDMWIGDVGQDSWEEFNYRRVDTSGVNFGWRCYEGNATYNTSVGCAGPTTNYVFPVHTYQTPSPSGAVTGGTVYRGNNLTDLQGYYVGTDFYTGILYLIKYNPATHLGTTTTQTPNPLISGISDFGETEDGELYAVSLTNGSVYRISAGTARVYTFTGTGNWNNINNWRNALMPPSDLPAGSEIIVSPTGNNDAILNIPQTVLAGAKIYVQPNKKFTVNGNLIQQ